MLLAQTNLALFRWPLSDQRMSGFAEQIQPVNDLAERSEGFVWRFAGEYEPREFGEPWSDPLLFFNMSVWRDFESLSRFINLDAHKAMMRDRARWTTPATGPSMAMWWIDDGVRPSIDDAMGAISSIAEKGDSRRAFTSRSSFRVLENWLENR